MSFQVHDVWHVTTEGDDEGRTVRDLGIHTGFLDEIAFNLAPRSSYSLDFRRVGKPVIEENAETQVHIRLSPEDDPLRWKMGPGEHLSSFKEAFHGRPVTVLPSNLYCAVLLRRELTDDQIRMVRRRAALSKLTPEEREILGLDTE